MQMTCSDNAASAEFQILQAGWSPSSEQHCKAGNRYSTLSFLWYLCHSMVQLRYHLSLAEQDLVNDIQAHHCHCWQQQQIVAQVDA